MSQVHASNSNCPRVLVAEDDPQMRRLVAEVLRGEGYEVEEVVDGEELLVCVIEASFPERTGARIDLIVSDVRMPAFSGLDVLRQLRGAVRDTPVLLITAFGDSALRTTVEDLGARLLDKPFPARELRAAVRELLSDGRPL